MKKLLIYCSLILFVFIVSAGSISAQGKYGKIGKLFRKIDADVLYGKVIQSATLTREEIKEALANAKDYIMFAIKNNKAYIINNRRMSVRAGDFMQLAPKEKAYLVSTTVVEDLLTTATTETITVEQRVEVLSLSTENATLEGIWPCPPICE